MQLRNMSFVAKLALVAVGGVAGVWIQQNYPESIPNLKTSANAALDRLKGVASK